MTNKKYAFGNILTNDNYQALRSLAQKLTYNEFHKTTGFGHGIHNRLRRFPEIKQYWQYIKQNKEKYNPGVAKKRITLQDIHKEILEIKQLLSNLNN